LSWSTGTSCFRWVHVGDPEHEGDIEVSGRSRVTLSELVDDFGHIGTDNKLWAVDRGRVCVNVAEA
jgi:hypothetical protein